MLGKLAKSKQHGSEFLKNAPLAIVICADSTKSDVWVEDCSIAAIIIQLTALSLGLGSCWAQIRDRQHDYEITAEGYIGAGMIGNYLYYRHVKANIIAIRSIQSPQNVVPVLQEMGGVNKWIVTIGIISMPHGSNVCSILFYHDCNYGAFYRNYDMTFLREQRTDVVSIRQIVSAAFENNPHRKPA